MVTGTLERGKLLPPYSFCLVFIGSCPWVEKSDLSLELQSFVLPQTGLGGAMGKPGLVLKYSFH